MRVPRLVITSEVRWIPPREMNIKINVDGSAIGNPLLLQLGLFFVIALLIFLEALCTILGMHPLSLLNCVLLCLLLKRQCRDIGLASE
jgi:hypothetical protein